MTWASDRPVPRTGCSCGRIKIGMAETEARNWSPDCQVHGEGTVWYNAPERQASRAEQNDQLKAMQTEATRVRRGGLPRPVCRGCGARHFSWDRTVCDDYDPVGPGGY